MEMTIFGMKLNSKGDHKKEDNNTCTNTHTHTHTHTLIFSISWFLYYISDNPMNVFIRTVVS